MPFCSVFLIINSRIAQIKLFIYKYAVWVMCLFLSILENNYAKKHVFKVIKPSKNVCIQQGLT